MWVGGVIFFLHTVDTQHLQVTSVDLHRHFHAMGAGVIEDVRIQRDKGFGFIRYSSHAEASRAIQMGNARILFGKPLKVYTLLFQLVYKIATLKGMIIDECPCPLGDKILDKITLKMKLCYHCCFLTDTCSSPVLVGQQANPSRNELNPTSSTSRSSTHARLLSC